MTNLQRIYTVLSSVEHFSIFQLIGVLFFFFYCFDSFSPLSSTSRQHTAGSCFYRACTSDFFILRIILCHLSEKCEHTEDCVKQSMAVILLLRTVSFMLNVFAASACGAHHFSIDCLMNGDWA